MLSLHTGPPCWPSVLSPSMLVQNDWANGTTYNAMRKNVASHSEFF